MYNFKPFTRKLKTDDIFLNRKLCRWWKNYAALSYRILQIPLNATISIQTIFAHPLSWLMNYLQWTWSQQGQLFLASWRSGLMRTKEVEVHAIKKTKKLAMVWKYKRTCPSDQGQQGWHVGNCVKIPKSASRNEVQHNAGLYKPYGCCWQEQLLPLCKEVG